MFIVGAQGLTINGTRRNPGEPVPEAAEWARDVREDNLRCGYIVEKADEPAPQKTQAKGSNKRA